MLENQYRFSGTIDKTTSKRGSFPILHQLMLSKGAFILCAGSADREQIAPVKHSPANKLTPLDCGSFRCSRHRLPSMVQGIPVGYRFEKSTPQTAAHRFVQSLCSQVKLYLTNTCHMTGSVNRDATLKIQQNACQRHLSVIKPAVIAAIATPFRASDWPAPAWHLTIVT